MAPLPPQQVPSGVPGLDELLGGGLPEGSCTLLGGNVGSGKTTLALQLAFANATPEQPALYCAGASEPASRTLQHQQAFQFFDADRLNRDVFVVDLGPHSCERDANRVLESLTAQVNFYQPGVVIVDAPRSLTPRSMWSDILLFLAQCAATSVLVTEGRWTDPDVAPATVVADNVVWLEQSETSRSVRVLKVRGHSTMPGAHALQLSARGMRVFPRWPSPRPRSGIAGGRLSTGIDALDRLLGGGVPTGDSVLVSGAAGTGKSVLATHFIAEGGHQGLPGLVCLVEERPDRFVQRAEALDLQLERLIHNGLVEVLSLRGRDLSADELIYLVQRGVLGLGAQHVVLDSLGGLELLLGSADVVQDCLWRMLDGLCTRGVSVWVNQPTPADQRVASLADHVWELRRTAEGRRLEVVKSSVGTDGTEAVTFELGKRGVQSIAPRATNAHASTNGHLLNYRYAAG